MHRDCIVLRAPGRITGEDYPRPALSVTSADRLYTWRMADVRLGLTNTGLWQAMRGFFKFFSVAVTVLVVIYALGPANWALRTGLGWQIKHFLGYFAVTSIVCLAWLEGSSWPARRCWRACKG